MYETTFRSAYGTTQANDVTFFPCPRTGIGLPSGLSIRPEFLVMKPKASSKSGLFWAFPTPAAYV